MMNPSQPFDRRISVAPMMEYTDRFCRYFLRTITRHTLLYTEMVTTGALLHGEKKRFLAYDPIEHPVALQLGGSNPAELATCARLAEDAGFDEVNLNCGCPSDRVQTGNFGACLMKSPGLVADGIAAMKDATRLPVTVKNRIGVDDFDSYGFLQEFVGQVSEQGCQTFIIHARKAWLSGLSPKQNREIPPLDYERVYQLKRDFPHLEIIINGGITSLNEVDNHLQWVDGVMVGREAYHNPYLLAEVDRRFYGDTAPVKSREEILADYCDYVDQQLARGVRLNHITRHILGLYSHQPGGKKFRRHLSENAHQPGNTAQLILDAAEFCSTREVSVYSG